MTCEHGLDREIVVCRQCESEETTAVERKLFLDLWDALPGHEATGDAAGSLRATLLLSAVGDEIRKTRLSADYFARYSANDFDPVTGTWLPIATAPKDGTEILAYTRSECFYVVAYDDVFSAPWRIRNDEGLNEAVPTHWMPLPDAPNDPNSGAARGPIAGGPLE